MHLQKRLSPEAGSTLVTVLIIGAISLIIISSMLALSGSSVRSAHARADWNTAFFHAENALEWAAQSIADASPVAGSNYYSTVNNTLTVPYLATARSDASSGLKNVWVSVWRTNASFPDNYLVTASARVNDKVRTISAMVRKNPPSQIFDYEYFLNNWGWWWGDSITGEGGNRANWDFDFRYDPVVNGLILASGSITENGTPVDPLSGTFPFGGLAGSDPVSLVHMGVSRLAMPNLQDFSYYKGKAMANTAANGIWVGGSQVVAGVHDDAATPGLYLVGTDAQPIVISNTVVVMGDVVLKGKITGKGTLYVGGNLYIAGDVTYKNGPDWSQPPETLAASDRDAWVSANQGTDLVGMAVRGSIFAGDVTSSDWIANCYNPPGYGLANVGDESHLGQDGIAGTPDDNIPFLHSDGTMSTWFDADGNGIVNSSYNYNTDINMTPTRASAIAGYPVDTSGAPVSYNAVASNNMNQLDAIFYTNHAAAMRLADNDAVFHGVIVSRDEAIIFNNTLKFFYDSRVNSRYNQDPNRYIDLGLPVALRLSVNGFTELAPNSTGL